MWSAAWGHPLKWYPRPFHGSAASNYVCTDVSAAYSAAKKTLITQSEAYSKQYNLNSSVIIPSNLYGEFDNFNESIMAVLPKA